MSQQINLFSPVFLTPKVYFSARAMLEALGLLMAGMAVLYGILLSQTRAVENERLNSDRLLQAERARLAEITNRFGPRNPSALLHQEIAKLEFTLGERQAILAMLHAQDARQHFSSLLRALSRQRQRGVWLTGIEVAGGGRSLSLTGRAIGTDNVPRYIAKLNHEPLLRGREFIALKLQADVPEADGENAGAGRTIDFTLQARPSQGAAHDGSRS